MIKFALENPIKVFVGVLFIVIFGITTLKSMPYRLIPPIEYPQISVSTRWSGATPYDMEREIVDPQERKLRTIPGLVDIESIASNGFARVSMLFDIEEDIDDAMLQVLNKLNEVRSYPEDVDNPTIKAANSDDSPSIMMMILPTDNYTSIDQFGSYVTEVVRPYFDRIDGVSDISISGGLNKEIHIKLDPHILALYKLTVGDVARILTDENITISAGTVDLGEREFRVLTEGEIQTPADLQEIVIISDGNSRVKFGDIADISFGYSKRTFTSNYNGDNGIFVGIIAEANTDVLALTKKVRATVDVLNNGILQDQHLKIEWLADQEDYILDALALVQSNILVGSVLAILVLLVFLRSVRSTLVIAVTIPISIIGTFFILGLFGRSLNVTSLAGIAFCVGMLIDNSIVVLENIDRHLKMNKTPFEAAYDGTKEVWGAVLISTLTTIAVFLPVVFIKEEAGQLFSDIALSVSAAVGLSLIVSVLVIPVATKLIYSTGKHKGKTKLTGKMKQIDEVITKIGVVSTSTLMQVSDKVNKSTKSKLIAIGGVTAFALISTYLLIPKMDYLPKGNKNLVEAFLTIPPGLSITGRTEISETLFKYVEPHIGVEKDGYPAIENFSFASGTWGISLYVTALDKNRAGEIVPLIAKGIATIPGIFGASNQSELFKIGRGSGSQLLLFVSGAMEYDELASKVLLIQNRVLENIEGAQVRSNPNANPVWPEIYFYPNREALKAAGISTNEMGMVLDSFLDGRKVAEITDAELGTIDIVLQGTSSLYNNPNEINSILVNSPYGPPVPLSNLATVVETLGVERIRRYNSQRSFSLSITTTEKMVLEELLNKTMDEVIEPLREEGLIDGIEVTTSGAADKLKQAQTALLSNMFLAVMITYLLMAALFNNFLYPLIILITLPLAATGGFLGLGATNLLLTSQPLDILTLLGFIMLIGIVVNNAVLIVHQSIANVQYGMSSKEAIADSVKTRLRPIGMSTLSSLFGMLPLVIAPGAGSELYRGLGSVIVGGLAFSTVFTVFIIPALLSFVLKDKVKSST